MEVDQMGEGLTPEERDLVLTALWDMKIATGRAHADADQLGEAELATAMDISEKIDSAAYKLGGMPGFMYGMGPN